MEKTGIMQGEAETEFQPGDYWFQRTHSCCSWVPALAFQIGHRDFDVEKRLRRDLRRTHALLSDVQLLLATMEDGKASVSKEELEKVHSQVGVEGPLLWRCKQWGHQQFGVPIGKRGLGGSVST